MGGGANLYAKDFISKELKNNNKILLVKYDSPKKKYILKYHHREKIIKYAFYEFAKLNELFDYIKLDRIIISELVSYKNPLHIAKEIEKIAHNQDCSLEILIHDFFCICPNFNLINKAGKYCEIPDSKYCKKCLTENRRDYFDLYTDTTDIYDWRKAWENILNTATKIVVFSNSSKNILQKIYPEIANEKIHIIPHQVEYLKPIALPQKTTSENINIGILGSIGFIKGSDIVRTMLSIIEKGKLPIKIIVIGELINNPKHQNLVITGKYKREELPRLVVENKIDLFFIPSIWPETFSYTTEEVMQMQMPIAVFNLGAPAERVMKYGKSLIIPEIDAKIALDLIIKFHKKIKRS